MNSKRINLNELTNILKIENSALICCSSFEERSTVIPSILKEKIFNFVFLFKNENLQSNKINENALFIKESYNYASIEITRTDDPLLTSNIIRNIISILIQNKIKNVIIDITTFTHEMLLMLLMNLYKNRIYFDNIQYLYLGAKDYSINENIDEKWLSKGCKKIRNVIGYPGKLIPGIPICLTVLVGYEHERAAIMIEEMDPEYLILGKGKPSDDSLTNPSHKAPMLHFQNILENFLSRRIETSSFEFSCSILESTYKKLKEVIETNKKFNHIIIPLNTKISTLAAGIVALENTNIQICYSEPEIYNFDGYSTSDENVTIIEGLFDIIN